MQHYFDFTRHNTSYRQEITAGITTFLTMAYIIIVNPAILEAAGIPKGASTTATILSAAFGTLVMGIYARRPFAIAPYMGENAYIAFTVVKGLGYPWQTALGAIFIAGVLFTVLTVFKVRSWLADAIPATLKHSFAVGIGLLLAFIGLNEIGIVACGVPGAPVCLGKVNSPAVLLAILGFLVVAWLMVRRVPGALVIGVLVTTLLSFIFKVTPLPHAVVSVPPSLAPIVGQLDIAGALSPKAFPVVLIVFVMAFLDTIGTLIGLSARAGLLNEHGNLPEIEKPMLADALSNLVAPLLGTTTTGAFIESAAGIEEGGRTGFTSVVVAALFILSLFLSPLFTAVPPHAYGIALVIIGVFMVAPITRIDFGDHTELIPAFLTITLICFTYNIGVGMTAGLLSYPVLKSVAGRHREIPRPLWLLFLMSLSFYLFYPYR